MRISDWSSDVCSSDLDSRPRADPTCPVPPVMRMSGIKKPSRSRGPADRYHNGAPIYLATIRGCRDTSAPCSSYLLRRSEMVPSPALSESWTHQWHSDGHGPEIGRAHV